MKRLIALLVIASCAGGDHRAARDRYNDGVGALGESKFEDAEKAFGDAINDAGVDPELRARAAFDLGVAYAEHAKQAQAAQPPDADKALELLHLAAGWFQDANRVMPDPDAKANLAIVSARAQALADEVNKGKNGLEPRLDRLIDGQRKVRDQVQGLWDAVVAAGASADPTAQRDAYEGTATVERTLLAEAGTISDMAGDEISAIGAKPEDQRKDEEKARLVQLQNLDLYVQDARTALGDARRQLHGQNGDPARRSAEAALESLKRAREQLLDPITVLQGIAKEEVQLGGDTDMVSNAEKDAKKIGGPAPTAPLTASMSPAVLGERQGRLVARVSEVIARLQAGVEHEDQAKDDQAKKTLAAVKKALPSVRAASTAMDKAKDALAGDRMDEALGDERDALVAIARAIEQFSDLKQLIDLTWADENQVSSLIAPQLKGAASAAGATGAAPGELTPDQRAREVEDRITQNVDRLGRMQGLIADEVAKADAPPPAAAPGQGQPAPDPQQVAAMKQRLARAEELRGQALTAVEDLDAKLKARGGDPQPSAREALDKLTELRKLFFSLIEHLQQLIRDQGETRDQTATARAALDDERAQALPGIAARQGEHQQMAQAIADALAKEADAAAQAQQQPQQAPAQPGQPDPAQQAKALADASQELRLAVDAMTGVSQALAEAQKQAQTASVDLQPTLDGQAKVIEHLENALRLLQPPPPPPDKDKKDKKDPKDKKDQQQQQQDKKDQQQQQDKKDQQQQQQQQQKQQQDDASAQEAQRRAQEVRDSEAKRQRERQEHQRIESEPVDKDW